ncbi:hypothetical protein EIN_153200 [Entamoeba invadens IP1]|uniref:HMG box domain-containing protein n=1 Tax=Entamoeba invadens IP1 TaxID=370355 RepID=A0A0A1UC88_ENTIV|nr:hypothetical protein EIN_153200 [Entamoeba invadens IP1]ELP91313.1 hypothetical protein EIN_153200 [Entamoeba invadens IP1]|eukprot:XP_004258084.1 hypothetical protein EIN_153200 [Entamoeba invadens IP1]
MRKNQNTQPAIGEEIAFLKDKKRESVLMSEKRKSVQKTKTWRSEMVQGFYGRKKRGGYKGYADQKTKEMPKTAGKPAKTNKAKVEKKPKKEKKTKDPNKPKKPQTAYMLYLNEHRAEIKEKFPDMKVTEVAKKAGENWKAMGEEDKKPYQDKADKAKETWKTEMKKYEEKKDGSAEEEEGEEDDE